MALRQWLVLLAVLLGSPLSAQGQELPPGSRVRLRLTESRVPWLEGVLLRLDQDSVRMVTGGGSDTLTVPTDSVSRLDLSLGQHSQTRRGLFIGGGIGAIAGLALSVAAISEECRGFGCYEVGPEHVIAVTAILAGAGAGLGALIGAASRREHWAEVPVPAPEPGVTVRLLPGSRGLSLSIRVPF